MSEAQANDFRRIVWRQCRYALLLAGLLFSSACQTPLGYSTPAAGAGASLRIIDTASMAGRYSISPELSDIRFLVYRAGPLASLGHNHVVKASAVKGEILLASDFYQSHFSLAIPVADFQVDAADARGEEGEEFNELPDAEAIAGTTRNMLGGNLLNAAVYPQINIHSVNLAGPASSPTVTVRIKLRAIEREMAVPVTIDYLKDEIRVTAVFEVKQTDFDITPLSVLGGAIQVTNSVKVKLRIRAQKA